MATASLNVESDKIVYICLVNYNGGKFTTECLASTLSIDKHKVHVVIVDNASTDNSVFEIHEWLLRHQSHVSHHGHMTRYEIQTVGHNNWTIIVDLIESVNNGGFAAGCNIGINLAIENHNCSYIWLLNNDTCIFPNTLSELITRMESDNEIGMCGSTLVYLDRPNMVQACGGKLNIFLGSGDALGKGSEVDKLPVREIIEHKMNYVPGASLLMTRRFVETTGLLDEDFFLYFEEIDLATRAKSNGFKIAWAPESIVVHKEGGSIGTSTIAIPSSLSIFFMSTSYLRFIRKHHPAYLVTSIAFTFLRSMKWISRNQWGLAFYTIKAIISFIRNPSSSRGLIDFKRNN